MYAAHQRPDALKYGVATMFGAAMGAVSSYLLFSNPKDDISAQNIAADDIAAQKRIAAEEVLEKEKRQIKQLRYELHANGAVFAYQSKELRAQERDYDARLKILEEREKQLNMLGLGE